MINIWKIVKPYTVVSMERIYNIIESVKKIIKDKIEGDFVECGVKRGGCCMAMDYTLKELGEKRTIWMYDVFDNRFEDCPSEKEIKVKGKFIVGDILETIPNKMPKKIALLRLDTNLYNSTYWELIHLFPLLEKGGILIIDDYGHHKGCKKAVDKYLSENNIKSKLIKIDYTGRWLIK